MEDPKAIHALSETASRRAFQALTELAAERGYRNLPLLAVLERAEVGQREFREGFRDLDDLARAALEFHTEALLARVGSAFLAQQGWANQLRAVAYELRDFLREDPARARLMVIEVLDAGPAAVAVRERGAGALTDLIDQGRSALQRPEAIPRSAAEIAAGAIYNRIHVGVERGVESLDDEMVRELMYTAVLPYLGIEAALRELDFPRTS
jgi:AcrR family transcriptional regulator